MGYDLNYNDLVKIEKLVQHVWDTAALVCLARAEQRLRYTDLFRHIQQWSGVFLNSTEMTRTRNRLLQRSFIAAQPSSNGHNLYAITDAGHARLAQIHRLLQVAPSLDQPQANAEDAQESTS